MNEFGNEPNATDAIHNDFYILFVLV